jgi:uncharacterized membrane protein
MADITAYSDAELAHLMREALAASGSHIEEVTRTKDSFAEFLGSIGFVIDKAIAIWNWIQDNWLF